MQNNICKKKNRNQLTNSGEVNARKSLNNKSNPKKIINKFFCALPKIETLNFNFRPDTFSVVSRRNIIRLSCPLLHASCAILDAYC